MVKHIEMYSTAGEYGLKTLFDPKEDATADVVFIHGLTGNRESTWTDPESKTFWPAALLPANLPTARILTFGYEADIIHTFDSKAIHTLAHHATLLTESLVLSRKSSASLHRPLIFVAHSLGGQVVEQALLLCHDSDDKALSAILVSTVGIAYLSTPHTGPDLVRWERTLVYLATMLHKTDEHVQHVLKPGAVMLARVEQEFMVMLEARRHAGKRKVELMCFYEAVGVPGVGLVVPWHSAVLTGSPHQSVHADHVGIAQFGSKEDAGYKAVAGQLEKWVDEVARV